jgi:hypothetical protein
VNDHEFSPEDIVAILAGETLTGKSVNSTGIYRPRCCPDEEWYLEQSDRFPVCPNHKRRTTWAWVRKIAPN